MASSLHTAPMYKATSGSMLVLGGEREPMLLVLLFSIGIVLAGLSTVTTLVGMVVWGSGSGLFRAMAARDAQMCRIYLRHRTRYPQICYAAQARPSGRGWRG